MPTDAYKTEQPKDIFIQWMKSTDSAALHAAAPKAAIAISAPVIIPATFIACGSSEPASQGKRVEGQTQ